MDLAHKHASEMLGILACYFEDAAGMMAPVRVYQRKHLCVCLFAHTCFEMCMEPYRERCCRVGTRERLRLLNPHKYYTTRAGKAHLNAC
jgi:hypothetical protein